MGNYITTASDHYQEMETRKTHLPHLPGRCVALCVCVCVCVCWREFFRRVRMEQDTGSVRNEPQADETVSLRSLPSVNVIVPDRTNRRVFMHGRICFLSCFLHATGF